MHNPKIQKMLRILADPVQVAKLQRFCGVEYEKPATCDQQTQTRGESSDSDSSNEQDRPSKCSQAVKAGIDCPISVIEDTNSNKFKAGHRVEHNNNLNKIINDQYSKNVKAKCAFNKILNSNGSHITEWSSRTYGKSGIVQCNQDPADVNQDGNVSKIKSSENVTAPSSSSIIRIKYRSLLYLARFGAFLGNEEFYLTFFPFCIWNLDSSLFRKVAMLWCVVMYFGQATKDYLRWPRPPCPPVVRLETHYSQEYSMPSTHAMAATAIPFCLAYFVIDRYQVPVPIAVAVAFLWFSVTCWSRLYLGVHTILDLLAGFIYALLILLTFLGYVDGYDIYQQTHPFAAPVLLITALALCTVCYPSNYKKSSKGDAVQIVAALTGVGIGSWLGYYLGYFHESEISQPYSIATPTLSWCGMAFLRFATGVTVLAFLYIVTRKPSIRFFSYMYGLDEPDMTFPGVMTAYKFTTYAVVGAGITLFVPLVHLYMGIHRPASFYEVL